MSKARDLANAADVLDDVSATELGYLDGVTSAIQTQLDAKTAKSTLTTKGDIYAATAASTPDRLAVGNSGDTLVADSSTTTGLRYQENFAAGKNKIINGDFSINQRGFTSTTTHLTYMFDRWVSTVAGDGTSTFSAQTFTIGTAPVAGYESTNFLRCESTGQTTSAVQTACVQRIEDVKTYAGQTVTVSFWAKAGSGTPSVSVEAFQAFGSGGSSGVSGSVADGTVKKQAITTSWARYSAVLTIPSISGKTVGTGSNLRVNLHTSAGSDFNTRTDSLGIQTATIDFWGVQVEAGSTATAFQTATGTLQGELAACQRYYQKSYNVNVAPATSTDVGCLTGLTQDNTSYFHMSSVSLGIRMRATPTVTIYSTTGASAKIRNVTAGTDVNASAVGTGQSGFTPFVNNSSVTGGIDFRCQWTSESEL
jgi:hypothetical protein